MNYPVDMRPSIGRVTVQETGWDLFQSANVCKLNIILEADYIDIRFLIYVQWFIANS